LLAGIFVAYVLGVLSKEMAITLPAIMLLYDWFREARAVQQTESKSDGGRSPIAEDRLAATKLLSSW
jgi:hypothetical protein